MKKIKRIRKVTSGPLFVLGNLKDSLFSNVNYEKDEFP